MKTYKGFITKLESNQIFVFGSNFNGVHGAGAAKYAHELFGAIWGQGEGLMGQSYGIVTVNLEDKGPRPNVPQVFIMEQIAKLYQYAVENPDKEFLVAYSGTGNNLNGYSNEEMAFMFLQDGVIPSNMVFEEGFYELIQEISNLKYF